MALHTNKYTYMLYTTVNNIYHTILQLN